MAKYKRRRSENIEVFKQIVNHIINSEEFYCGGITSAEKVFTGFKDISKNEISNIEIKLYFAFKKIIKNEI